MSFDKRYYVQVRPHPADETKRRVVVVYTGPYSVGHVCHYRDVDAEVADENAAFLSKSYACPVRDPQD